MKISLNWLSKYVAIEDHTPQQIADILTDLGLEVEAVEKVEGLDSKVVVGKIESAKTHPNADKLQVCEVDVGGNDKLTIVCGAPNARPGLYVAVAQIGAVLPGDFKIKPSKIRGEKSAGMLCSAQELGLGEANEGIIELAEDLPLGGTLADIYKLSDTVLEIGLTPNRSDCLGYIGVARDLAAKLGTELKTPQIPESFGDKSLDTATKVEIKISAPEDSGRFSALFVDQVKTIESPLWLQKSLEYSGMRPINVVVDVTNYVMLETGQPIHAYDIRDIAGAEISVRRAKKGETLVTLDGQKRTLSEDDIVIADQGKAVGLAGVMGGENSEVKDDTTQIVIEVAHFNPTSVRKTAKRHGIHSEASHRFERGVDITATDYVAQRVAQLIQQCLMEQDKGSQAKIAANLVDIYPEKRTLSKIALRTDRARQITGIRTLTQSECITQLKRLGFKFLDKTDERALFEVPSWRLDIERETDLIEEVARLHGYSTIPYTLPMMEIGAIPERPLIDFTDQCKYATASQGFTEVISFPFISREDLSSFNIPDNHPFAQTVELANPLVEDQRFLRTSVVFGLLKALVNNRKHGTKGARLFEAARNFYKIDGNESLGAWEQLKTNGAHIVGKARQDHRPIERNILAAIIDQPFSDKDWQQPEQASSFFHGKEAVIDLLNSMGFSDPEFSKIEGDEIPWLHPGIAAKIEFDGEILGYVGELHPKTVKSFGLSIDQAPIVFELDLELVLKASSADKAYMGSSLKFPPVTRDLAFVVDRAVSHKDFEKTFSSFNRRKNLSSYRLFDVYQGDNLAAGKKSMAFSLAFQSDKKTLTDKEVEKEVGALVEWFKTQLSAELR